ncbi:MAG: OadG family transporter subunit [Prolixibacteraceae bacterium]|jgi:Na+-transporting methylmalonyl-CoA/oxaloacetate decarboxylase gamma subunit|nr:OadG family transporter subunit [Prolixibacteraceae bacterium]
MQKRNLKLLSGIFILLAILLFADRIKAQNASDLRFNEILVLNDSNFVDDFGQHSPWIEIFNSAYNSVDIGGCYLTDDLNNPTKYWIPVGDPATLIPPRCYVVFWADNMPTRGIFHLNFNLEKAKLIALFDASGRTLIDKLEIPQSQKVDITYGRIADYSDEWEYLEHSTPGANNDHSRKASSGEKFVAMDPSGLGMAMIAMSVVFSALAMLYLIFRRIGKFFVRKTAKGAKGKSKVVAEGEMKVVKSAKEEMSGEVNAAIAMALYLYQSEMHDHEHTVLTIQKVSRNYSPWSSKIYMLRKTPR